MTKNKGYTLMELMIVIAIIGIMTGVSFITLGVIKEANCSSAVNTFNNQISSCLIRTKAVSDATTDSSVGDAPLCMVIKKRKDDRYAIITGYYTDTGVKAADGTDLKSDSNYAEVDANCEAVLPKEIVGIKYTASSADQKATIATDEFMVIRFVKSDGSVKYGAGTYELSTNKGGDIYVYATVQVDAMTGNHYNK